MPLNKQKKYKTIGGAFLFGSRQVLSASIWLDFSAPCKSLCRWGVKYADSHPYTLTKRIGAQCMLLNCSYEDMDSVEYPFIAITPMSTLT